MGQVLEARYGPSDTYLNSDLVNRKASQWWRDLMSILRLVDFWIDDNVFRKVGNGASTRFWDFRWIGGMRLMEIFPRLYSASENFLIQDCGYFEDEHWSWYLGWRHPLF
jgi:hypothetical protein